TATRRGSSCSRSIRRAQRTKLPRAPTTECPSRSTSWTSFSLDSPSRGSTRGSCALVELDHVAVGIAHEHAARVGAEPARAAAEWDAGGSELCAGGLEIGAEQREVRDAGMLCGAVHEDVRRPC